MRQLFTRLGKMEKAILPQTPNYPIVICTTATQIGLDGEVVSEETGDEAVQKHLAQHPEDTGRKFIVMRRVFVSPNHDKAEHDQ